MAVSIKKKRGQRILVTSDGKEFRINPAKAGTLAERKAAIKRITSRIKSDVTIDTSRLSRGQ